MYQVDTGIAKYVPNGFQAGTWRTKCQVLRVLHELKSAALRFKTRNSCEFLGNSSEKRDQIK